MEVGLRPGVEVGLSGFFPVPEFTVGLGPGMGLEVGAGVGLVLGIGLEPALLRSAISLSSVQEVA